MAAKKPSCPTSVTVQVREDGLHLVYRWFNSRYIILALIDVLLWVTLGNALAVERQMQAATISLFLFGLAFGGIVLGMSYGTLAGWLNSTHIVLTPTELCIRHTPLPGWGPQHIQRADVEQLYCQERVYVTQGRGGLSQEV